MPQSILMPSVQLITLDPAHFHAALVQKEMYAAVSPLVTVYAPLGLDLTEHLTRVARFNQRADAPTTWELDVHAGPDSLARMLGVTVPDWLRLPPRVRKPPAPRPATPAPTPAATGTGTPDRPLPPEIRAAARAWKKYGL